MILIASTIVTALLVIALISVSSPSTNYNDVVLMRIARDKQLQDSYVQFAADHGRAPTTRELWDISPPANQMETP